MSYSGIKQPVSGRQERPNCKTCRTTTNVSCQCDRMVVFLTIIFGLCLRLFAFRNLLAAPLRCQIAPYQLACYCIFSCRHSDGCLTCFKSFNSSISACVLCVLAALTMAESLAYSVSTHSRQLVCQCARSLRCLPQRVASAGFIFQYLAAQVLPNAWRAQACAYLNNGRVLTMKFELKVFRFQQ